MAMNFGLCFLRGNPDLALRQVHLSLFCYLKQPEPNIETSMSFAHQLSLMPDTTSCELCLSSAQRRAMATADSVTYTMD